MEFFVLFVCVVFSFQRKVEMFHDTQSEFGDHGDGYVSRTISLVNCVPPFRFFILFTLSIYSNLSQFRFFS